MRMTSFCEFGLHCTGFAEIDLMRVADSSAFEPLKGTTGSLSAFGQCESVWTIACELQESFCSKNCSCTRSKRICTKHSPFTQYLPLGAHGVPSGKLPIVRMKLFSDRWHQILHGDWSSTGGEIMKLLKLTLKSLARQQQIGRVGRLTQLGALLTRKFIRRHLHCGAFVLVRAE